MDWMIAFKYGVFSENYLYLASNLLLNLKGSCRDGEEWLWEEYFCEGQFRILVKF